MKRIAKFVLFFVFASGNVAFSQRLVKVAILDNSFGSQEDVRAIGGGAVSFHPGPVAPPTTSESHGLLVTQLLLKFLQERRGPPVDYHLHLYESYGYSNFSAAVKDVIRNNIDIVLYAQVWEYGGNGDGTGFINNLVNQALWAGVLWINAAGNFEGNTFNSKIDIADDGWLYLPEGGIRIACRNNSTGGCSLRSVLSWNDFKDDVEEGTNKDLDFYLTDENLKPLAASELTQKTTLSPTSEQGTSKYPREIIEVQTNPGIYILRVKAKSKIWSKKDKLRITLSGKNLSMQTPSPQESILNPADHPNVVTVGSCDTATSSVSLNLNKPDLIARSIIGLQSGGTLSGSSVAAARVAAGAVVLESRLGRLTRDNFVGLVTPKPFSRGPPIQFSLCGSSPKTFLMPLF